MDDAAGVRGAERADDQLEDRHRRRHPERDARATVVPTEPRGLHMPIDAFLRSLAEDQGDNAIGIVMSGTGTDGTLGLRAVFGAGGLCLVQDPATTGTLPTEAEAAEFLKEMGVAPTVDPGASK